MEPKAFLEVLRRELEHHCRVGPGDLGIVAVSGGPDSMVLLDVLRRLGPSLGLRLEVVTVDHGLRPEATDEARLVAEVAGGLGLPHRVVRVEARWRAERDGEGLQAAARLERLEALGSERRARGARWVALGHTRADQAETVLLRLARGTGLDGLGCMPSRRAGLIRPLLRTSRESVRRYAEKQGLRFVSDPSNEDRRFARVVVRRDLLPLTSEAGLSSLAERAARLGGTLRSAEDAWARRRLRRLGTSFVVRRSTGGRDPLPAPVAARCLRACLARAGLAGRLPDRGATEALVRVASVGRGEVHVHGLRALSSRAEPQGLLVASGRPERPAGEGIVVTGPGLYRDEGLRLSVVAGGRPCSPIWGLLEPGGAFRVRARLPGDRFEGGSRLKRRLGGQRVWRELRDWIPVVERGGVVLWTALDPCRDRDGMVVSLCLATDHPLRLWTGAGPRATPRRAPRSP